MHYSQVLDLGDLVPWMLAIGPDGALYVTVDIQYEAQSSYGNPAEYGSTGSILRVELLPDGEVCHRAVNGYASIQSGWLTMLQRLLRQKLGTIAPPRARVAVVMHRHHGFRHNICGSGCGRAEAAVRAVL